MVLVAKKRSDFIPYVTLFYLNTVASLSGENRLQWSVLRCSDHLSEHFLNFRFDENLLRLTPQDYGAQIFLPTAPTRCASFMDKLDDVLQSKRQIQIQVT